MREEERHAVNGKSCENLPKTTGTIRQAQLLLAVFGRISSLVVDIKSYEKYAVSYGKAGRIRQCFDLALLGKEEAP